MLNVTTVGMILGSLVILAAIVIALRRNDLPKNAFVFLGIGAFLIAGSQWASFKVSTDGIEVLRQQVQQTSKAVNVTQTQLAGLSSELEVNKFVSRGATRVLYERLAAAPPAHYSLSADYAAMRVSPDTASRLTTTTRTTAKKR